MKRKKIDRRIWFFSIKGLFEVSLIIVSNITSGYFGLILISPGFLGLSLNSGNLWLLFWNFVFGILGLLVSLLLYERSQDYGQA